jgi:hypothetical protein
VFDKKTGIERGIPPAMKRDQEQDERERRNCEMMAEPTWREQLESMG